MNPTLHPGQQDEDLKAALRIIVRQPANTRRRMIEHAEGGNPYGWSSILVRLLRAFGQAVRNADDLRQLRRELRQGSSRAKQPRRPQATPRTPRRSPRRRTARTAQDPGDGEASDPDSDPDLDPVERRVRQLVGQAPPLSAGQRQLLGRILSGAR